MLMGASSRMDDLFLPTSFTPSSLAQELRGDMEQDSAPSLPHHSSSAPHPHPEEGTTRILMDALVTTPTPTTRWYQATLTSVLVTLLVLGGVALGRGYIRLVLLWLEGADVGVGVLIFTLLIFIISFPLFWGYALLLLAAGYLYGSVQGPLLVLLCTALALTAANSLMRSCCRHALMDRLYSAKVQAILQLLNSPQGIKIVALTRLTPIPFGLQNALFSLSDMRQAGYVMSSVLGISPMAGLYCYMGSTLRSMEDVLGDTSSQLTGYLILGGQMVFTALLACFVVRKARGELKKAMEQSTAATPPPDSSCVVMD
ncbi:transmembrane protein 64-like [Babylonia areolata]|uniref:transmembrane protein 64-like n=1 Tax=Babylonia areolata TaxID=304850 RepID=UPI003FD06531